jgi:protein TonB
VFSPLPIRRRPLGPTSLSLAAHAVLAGVFLIVLRQHPVKVFTLPGSDLGTRVELAYLPGRAPAPTPRPQAKVKPKAVPTPKITPAPAVEAAKTPSPNLSSPASAVPDSSSGSDSWGSGSIQIALTTYSPSPAPDLSVLPHGVQGDVVVDVTIDPSGKVADLAVLHSLGYGIETSVIGTLRTWTFRPATKDGNPISSVQELHFHFGPV